MSRVVPSAQAMAVRVLAVAGLALLGACGPAGGDGPVDSGGESWPLQVDTPGVLGYVALRATPERVGDFLDAQVGWRPAGLDADSPLVLLMLDHTVLGGDMAFGMPVSDAPAFERSLRECPAVTDLGGDRFHVNLPADHPLARMQRTLAGMEESGASPGALIGALASQQEYAIAVQLRMDGDWALLVPSFEAGVVASGALSEVPGLLRDGDETFVLSLDAERIADTYHEQIQGVRAQLRSVLLGTQLGGFAAMLNAARRGEGSATDRLPVNGEFLWTLIGMLHVDEVRALQVSTRDVDVFALVESPLDLMESMAATATDEQPASDEAAPLPPGGADVRLAFAEESDLTALLGALRPAPELPGARMTLAADPDVFAAAIARWARPVLEFVHGEGPPAERALDELEELLSPWAGLVTVVEGRDGGLSLGLATRGSFDDAALAAWLDEVADAATWEGARPWASLGAGSEVDGWGWIESDDVLLYADTTAGSDLGAAMAGVREARDAWADPDGPALRLDLPDQRPQGLRAHGDELILELRWGDDGSTPPR